MHEDGCPTSGNYLVLGSAASWWYYLPWSTAEANQHTCGCGGAHRWCVWIYGAMYLTLEIDFDSQTLGVEGMCHWRSIKFPYSFTFSSLQEQNHAWNALMVTLRSLKTYPPRLLSSGKVTLMHMCCYIEVVFGKVVRFCYWVYSHCPTFMLCIYCVKLLVFSVSSLMIWSSFPTRL